MDLTAQLTLASLLWIATSEDWRTQKIPSSLIGPMLVLGLAFNVLYSLHFHTWTPILSSVAGASIMLAIAVFLVKVKFWGAGDSKLLIACAAFYGFSNELLTFTLITIMAVGVTLLVQYLRTRKYEWVAQAHCFLVAWLVVFLEPIVKGLF